MLRRHRRGACQRHRPADWKLAGYGEDRLMKDRLMKMRADSRYFVNLIGPRPNYLDNAGPLACQRLTPQS